MNRHGKETRASFLLAQQMRSMKEKETIALVTPQGNYIFELVEFKEPKLNGPQPDCVIYDECGQLSKEVYDAMLKKKL